MPEFEVSWQLEKQSLEDLKTILEEAQALGVNLALIGGYATRAYMKPTHYRGTKDIDFITQKSGYGKLKGILKHLGYAVTETRHGLKASKKTQAGEIKLDIASDKIVDESSALEYVLPSTSFQRVVQLPITALYEQNSSLTIQALVAPVEDVLIMKLCTDMLQRPRDRFDAAAILLDSPSRLDAKLFAQNATSAGLEKHVKKRIEEILVLIKQNKLPALWREYSNLELPRSQQNEIKKGLETLFEALKS